MPGREGTVLRKDTAPTHDWQPQFGAKQNFKKMEIISSSTSAARRSAQERKARLNLYDNPPSDELSLDEFEEYSILRLEGV